MAVVISLLSSYPLQQLCVAPIFELFDLLMIFLLRPFVSTSEAMFNTFYPCAALAIYAMPLAFLASEDNASDSQNIVLLLCLAAMLVALSQLIKGIAEAIRDSLAASKEPAADQDRVKDDRKTLELN
jgi:hypothetical protein